MSTASVPGELFSALLFGDNDEFQSFLGDDLAGFKMDSFSSLLMPYLTLMGDEDKALTMAEEASGDEDSTPKPQTAPILMESVKKLEDVKGIGMGFGVAQDECRREVVAS